MLRVLKYFMIALLFMVFTTSCMMLGGGPYHHLEESETVSLQLSAY